MINCTCVVRVAADPETRDAAGTPVVSWRGASNEKRKGEEVVTWLAFSWFGERAVKVAPYIRKGEKLAITGSLSTRTYTDREGKERTSVEVRVNDVELLTPKPKEAGATPRAHAADEADLPF